MPYNKDGSKKKNPSKADWKAYHVRKSSGKKRPYGGSSAGGASIVEKHL